MRCQVLKKKVGYGATRCPRQALPNARECASCQQKRLRKAANTVSTALGKPGKNPGWRDPELREYVRSLPCILAGHPLHRCAGVCERQQVEAAHVTTKAHAGDAENLFPACPSLHDEQEGQTKAFERKYGVNLKALAKQVTAGFLAEKGLTV